MKIINPKLIVRRQELKGGKKTKAMDKPLLSRVILHCMRIHACRNIWFLIGQ